MLRFVSCARLVVVEIRYAAVSSSGVAGGLCSPFFSPSAGGPSLPQNPCPCPLAFRVGPPAGAGRPGPRPDPGLTRPSRRTGNRVFRSDSEEWAGCGPGRAVLDLALARPVPRGFDAARGRRLLGPPCFGRTGSARTVPILRGRCVGSIAVWVSESTWPGVPGPDKLAWLAMTFGVAVLPCGFPSLGPGVCVGGFHAVARRRRRRAAYEAGGRVAQRGPHHVRLMSFPFTPSCVLARTGSGPSVSLPVGAAGCEQILHSRRPCAIGSGL